MGTLFDWIRWLLVLPDRRAEAAPARSWLGWLLSLIQGSFGISSWQRTDGSWRGFFTWLLRTLQGGVVRVALLLPVLVGCVYLVLCGSLPDVAGTRSIAGLSGEVRIDRDGQSIPTVHATSRGDLFLGLGYLHAQERYFSMDLSRRYAAGELAELFGSTAVEADRFYRPLRLRQTARDFVKGLKPEQRVDLDAYVKGVNAGLANLVTRPPEYLILGAQPKPWEPEDTCLVLLSVSLMLQDDNWRIERYRDAANQTVPPVLWDLIDARGTEWDAPLKGKAFSTPRLPTAEEFDVRRQRIPQRGWFGKLLDEPPISGSNNWAIAGSETKHGKAILANDMHLDLRAPTIWYRAGLEWTGRDGQPRKAWGVTYPGTPGIVVGSNQLVAWGLTNAEVDTSDLIRLERDPLNPRRYRTPEGMKEFTVHEETVFVNGDEAELLQVEQTIWGPVLPSDPRYALRWIPQVPGGFNLGWLDLLEARTLEEVLDAANRTSGPHQNFVAVDNAGAIGWTLLGAIPKRVGFDGRLPVSWADGTCRWDGFHPPSVNPRIVRPANGRLWTANNRVVDEPALSLVGEAGFDRGARAGQIRDDLLALRQPEEAEVYAIALDDRALFLAPWKKLMLDVLAKVESPDAEGLAWLRREVASSADRASADAIGYRLVAEFREVASRDVLEPLVQGCYPVCPDFTLLFFRQREGAVWKILQERPAHLLSRGHADWDDLLRQAALHPLTKARQSPEGLAGYTWGARNRSRISHPLGDALGQVPIAGGWLSGRMNMERRALDGSPADLPRVQGNTHGASQRMVVSPGREEFGSFQIPCGQSGHFLSPHYRNMHDAWSTGERTPFLPGPTVTTLVLKP